MSTKFEQLLDLIVNEEMDKANELFHEIVVEKSRDIYENMIAEEADEEEDESVEEASEEEDDEEVEEGFGMDDESAMEIGGDETDDLVGGVSDQDAMGGDEMDGAEMGGTEPATKDDVMDLKDALDQLTAEFEALMNGDSGEESDGEEEPEFGDEEGSEDDGEEFGDEEDDADESMRMGVREYRETVGNDWHKNSMKSPGPVGSGTGDKAGQATETSTKSVGLQNPKGRPQTTASAKNILGSSGTAEGTNTGTSPNGKTGGLAGGVKGEFTKGVEKNISSSSKSSMKSGSATNKQGSGYPGNNKSAGPVGSGTGDKAGQTSVGVVKSPLNGAPGRHA